MDKKCLKENEKKQIRNSFRQELASTAISGMEFGVYVEALAKVLHIYVHFWDHEQSGNFTGENICICVFIGVRRCEKINFTKGKIISAHDFRELVLFFISWFHLRILKVDSMVGTSTSHWLNCSCDFFCRPITLPSWKASLQHSGYTLYVHPNKGNRTVRGQPGKQVTQSEDRLLPELCA